ncbi:hypothetical protein [Streptomyces sp. ME18-1-4]|uniref:hypothetical protein n=1 Tax=Streptomyces sp. ME18-1-4 TaxID=3028685 RepID=UPI0029A7F6CE|nr:hypothetical protein [Streptomyces sp. ME18-1-4]MDX3248665.1 hypothetical protein [Streptomyces sp. ME18-1-4]
MATELACSHKTVEQRLTRLFQRTGSRSRAQPHPREPTHTEPPPAPARDGTRWSTRLRSWGHGSGSGRTFRLTVSAYQGRVTCTASSAPYASNTRGRSPCAETNPRGCHRLRMVTAGAGAGGRLAVVRTRLGGVG